MNSRSCQCTPGLEDRVKPHGKARGLARELERAGEESRRLLRPSGRSSPLPVAGREPDGHEERRLRWTNSAASTRPAPSIHEGGLPVGRQRLVDDAERIAPVQLAVKVDPVEKMSTSWAAMWSEARPRRWLRTGWFTEPLPSRT